MQDNDSDQKKKCTLCPPLACPDQRRADDFLFTERAREVRVGSDGLLRCIANFSWPVKLKALALIHTGVQHSLISQKLAAQLNLATLPTSKAQTDPIGDRRLKIYGEHDLPVEVEDHAGSTDGFLVKFLVTDLVEDLILGMTGSRKQIYLTQLFGR